MYSIPFYITCVTIIMLIIMGTYIASSKHKKVLHYVFVMVVIEVFVWNGAVLLQGVFSDNRALFLIFEKSTYIGSAFVPVSLIFLGRVYGQSGKGLTKKHLLLLVIPVITQIMVWTNESHHLFYLAYGFGGEANTPSIYFWFHVAYSYICLLLGLIFLSYYAIKNSGILSIQALLILIGSILPALANVCYTLNVPGFDMYSTPIAFTATLTFYMIGMFRYNLLKLTPIALQTVINRISDSFVVVDTEMNIIDYNQPFADNFHYLTGLRKGYDLYKILSETQVEAMDADLFRNIILSAAEASDTLIKDIDVEVEGVRQYFTIEITPILQRSKCIGIILLFKNITQHVKNMKKIQDNQDILLERERLASLGQLIGGIAHNLKTPIMSVAGGIDQIQWLAEEYSSSVGDSSVTNDDHKEIATEMKQWLTKMKSHMAYMSDIISTVKDQASKFNNPGFAWFTIDEMLKRIQILMQHEIVKNKCKFTQDIRVGREFRIDGDVNSLVQILDNIIVNAIHSYEGKGGEIIFSITREEANITITISDKGKGIDEKVKDRLFKEMVTTKGKHGTGLGLYMSYSTIKGMFRGDMWFESAVGQGTKFYIQLPTKVEEKTEENQYA